ncbi:MAG: hypothetical protein ACRD5H_09115 [Nitrososphaerales archaeon]
MGTIYKEIGLFALQIHEVGNTLANTKFLDVDESLAPQRWRDARRRVGIADEDVGAAFETCVFGGLVGLVSGKVGDKRELR